MLNTVGLLPNDQVAVAGHDAEDAVCTWRLRCRARCGGQYVVHRDQLEALLDSPGRRVVVLGTDLG